MNMMESGYFTNDTKAHLTAEGVEIMNLLMTLSDHDKDLYKQIMTGGNDPYLFFRKNLLDTSPSILWTYFLFFFFLLLSHCVFTFYLFYLFPPPAPKVKRWDV
jgi:hypothetical protein